MKIGNKSKAILMTRSNSWNTPIYNLKLGTEEESQKEVIKMKNDNFKEIGKIFRNYKDNKKKLETDYKIPVPSGVRYDKISVKTDPSINSVENMTVEYIAERERLFKEVYIVDEVLRYFKLEGHGRERFIYSFLINRCSWVKAEMDCYVSRTTLCYWRRDVFEKAYTVANWINYF